MGDFSDEAGTDGLAVVASRDEILRCDISGPLEVLQTLLSTKERVLRFRDRVDWGVAGYDDSPKELFEIEEVRDFMRLLDGQFPFWFYFLEKRVEHSPIRLLAFCLCRYTRVTPTLVQLDQGDLQDFLNQHFVAINWIFDRFDLDERENERISEDIVRLFAGV